MKKYIIITSIFGPTEAVKKFAMKFKDYQLVVVGDKKSPESWKFPNVTYLSVDDQLKLKYNISQTLPYNHYCRKMIGYVYAISNGAEIIVDTDDDNIPYDDWNFPNLKGEFKTVLNKGFVNIYQAFSDEFIWPRGLPLDLIKKREPFKTEKKVSKVGIWQGLADEDPDVDAIYRLIFNKPCYFEKREPIVLSNKTISPFNSQNTMFIKEMFPLLYLPCLVTFRFTDILRGLVAQPIMWLYNYKLGITNATVIQKRNEHDYYKDFESEIPCFIDGPKVIDIVSAVISADNNISDNLIAAYEALVNENIVPQGEIEILKSWTASIDG